MTILVNVLILVVVTMRWGSSGSAPSLFLEAPYIKWSEQKLTENDFKKKDSMYHAATITTGIIYESGVVYAVCDPNNSFIKSKVDNIQWVLAHEQLHFDIAEYIARQLNKSKNKLVDWDYWNKKLYQMQEQYDYETQHSQNKYQQNLWEFKMKQLLYHK